MSTKKTVKNNPQCGTGHPVKVKCGTGYDVTRKTKNGVKTYHVDGWERDYTSKEKQAHKFQEDYREFIDDIENFAEGLDIETYWFDAMLNELYGHYKTKLKKNKDWFEKELSKWWKKRFGTDEKKMNNEDVIYLYDLYNNAIEDGKKPKQALELIYEEYLNLSPTHKKKVSSFVNNFIKKTSKEYNINLDKLKDSVKKKIDDEKIKSFKDEYELGIDMIKNKLMTPEQVYHALNKLKDINKEKYKGLNKKLLILLTALKKKYDIKNTKTPKINPCKEVKKIPQQLIKKYGKDRIYKFITGYDMKKAPMKNPPKLSTIEDKLFWKEAVSITYSKDKKQPFKTDNDFWKYATGTFKNLKKGTKPNKSSKKTSKKAPKKNPKTKSKTNKTQAQIKAERLKNLEKARKARAENLANDKKKDKAKNKTKTKANNKANNKAKTNNKPKSTAENAKKIYETFHLFEAGKEIKLKIPQWDNGDKIHYVGEILAIQYSSDKYDKNVNSWIHESKVTGHAYIYKGNIFLNVQWKVSPRGLEDDKSIRLAKEAKDYIYPLGLKEVAVLGNKVGLKVKLHNGLNAWFKPTKPKESYLVTDRFNTWFVMVGNYKTIYNNKPYLEELQ